MLANTFSMSLLSAGMIFSGASVAPANGDPSDGTYRGFQIKIRVEYPGEIQDRDRDGRFAGQGDRQDYPAINGHYTPFSPEIFSPYGRAVR